MNMAKHWRTMLDSKTLGVGDFPDGVTEWTLRISKVAAGKVTYAEGPASRGLFSFEGVTKPYSAGATFMSQVAVMYGDDFSNWPGKLVTLYATKVKSFGETKDAIRVKPRIPKPGDLWGAKYDHAATMKAIAACVDADELKDIRAATKAQQPAKEFHAAIIEAIKAAEDRIAAIPSSASDDPAVDDAAKVDEIEL